jgi:hypothetical protein
MALDFDIISRQQGLKCLRSEVTVTIIDLVKVLDDMRLGT